MSLLYTRITRDFLSLKTKKQKISDRTEYIDKSVTPLMFSNNLNYNKKIYKIY